MLDIVSVVFGAISICQGWRNTKTDKEKSESLLSFLDSLSTLDEIFYTAKKIHDCSDLLLKVIPDTGRTIKQFGQGDLSPNQINMASKNFIGHMDDYFKRAPSKLSKLSGDIKLIEESSNLTNELKDNISKVLDYHAKIIDNIECIKKSFESLKKTDLSVQGYLCTYQRYFHEIDNAIQTSLRNADITIYNIANVINFLHIEMRKATQQK